MSHNPVLASARRVASKARHVSLNLPGIETAASKLLSRLETRPYTPASWSETPLHPVPRLRSPEWIANWILLVSTLNFSFWSDLPADRRYGVRFYKAVDGKPGCDVETIHTGYWSLIAAIHRAERENVDLTDPTVLVSKSDDWWGQVFRSDQEEEIPLLKERIKVTRETGNALIKRCQNNFSSLIQEANRSALKLVDLVIETFPAFDDKAVYDGETVYIRKRAQILVSELWAAFGGESLGQFDDIDELTMFADYRVPQILHSLETINYSPELVRALKEHRDLPNGSPMEVEIRALSIVANDELSKAIARLAQESKSSVDVPNAVTLDFLLWDMAKEEEAAGREASPHHRTRSIFY